MKRKKRKLKLSSFFNKRNHKNRKKHSGKNDEFLRLLF